MQTTEQCLQWKRKTERERETWSPVESTERKNSNGKIMTERYSRRATNNQDKKNTSNIEEVKPLICHESAIDKWQHANGRQY